MPEDNVGKAMFTYNVYKQLVEFMMAQGSLIGHVEPKYLLAYDDYCLYYKLVPSTSRSLDTSVESSCSEERSSDLLSPEYFNSISIQCWLDLFLQMFRTFILGPAVGMKVGTLDQEILKRATGIEMYRKLVIQESEVSKRPTDVTLKRTVYSRAEEILLSWLTHSYNSQRKLVWPAKCPAMRMVNSFDFDLEDGLVLAAVTAAYCPFLIPIYFQDMFLEPVTVSQAYHNTICLVNAWDRIKLGFSVTPRDFSRPNSVKMLMLVTHLYKILPSYKPTTTIKFKATLNSSEMQIVTLGNVEESAITYKVEILQNTICFSLEDCKDSFVLKRKEKGQITVRYTARNTVKVKAILLLCGACMPPKFGRNYVVSLEGNPVNLPVTSIFNLISPLNSASTTLITIESPHVLDKSVEQPIDYDIWIADTEPQPGNLNALCWEKERKRKVPRRLFILSDILSVRHENRQISGKLLLQICCFSMTVNHYWLIFMNPEIGDFIVKNQILDYAYYNGC